MDFVSAIIYILKRLHKVVFISLIVGVLTFLGASLIPKTYGTEARLVMAGGDKGSSAFSGLSALSGGMNLLGANKSVDPVFIECLNAREIRYSMIPIFGFDTVYSKSKLRDLIVNEINEKLEIFVDEATFVISVSYEGKSKKQNIEIVKYVVKEAISKYKSLQNEGILESTNFLRGKLLVLNDSLEALQNDFLNISKTNDIIDIDEQVKATALYLSNFEQKLFELKLKKRVTALEFGPKSINVKNIQSQIVSLSQELNRMKKGKSKAFTFWINPAKTVGQKLSLTELEVKMNLIGQLVQMTQVELLSTEAELRKKSSVVQVIQEAYTPDQKKGPKRILWVIAAILITMITMCIRYIIKGIQSSFIKVDSETRQVLKQFNIV